MVDHKTDNKKAARLDTGAASKQTFDSRNDTKHDPLIAWFNIAKPSRDRQQKRGWKRNNRGRIDPLLAVHIGLLALAALLILGGRYA